MAGACALVIGMQGEAWAAITMTLKDGGGKGYWSADPSGNTPGDAIKACDDEDDGWGIQLELDINRDGTTDRIATTRGHKSPYCSPWKTGDIKEGTEVTLRLYKVKGKEIGPYWTTMNSKA
ncbi:hypothetical protein ABTY35_19550 [Streptomyces fimicarius]|uniref:hypothetical protein n=1 Tax=Streptomyces griseus group TaxID=629295 RepID=UPI001F3AC4E0|nr:MULTISPECIES: hypothetical protein [Streptomyces fimicarius subgroup]